MCRSASQLPPSMKLKAPCAQCPFRKDQDFLSTGRKLQLVYETAHLGLSFSCHKTLDYQRGEGELIAEVSQHCAGSLHFLHQIDRPNQVMQIGGRLGVWSIGDLQGGESIHDSIESFVGMGIGTLDAVVLHHRHVQQRRGKSRAFHALG